MVHSQIRIVQVRLGQLLLPETWSICMDYGNKPVDSGRTLQNDYRSLDTPAMLSVADPKSLSGSRGRIAIPYDVLSETLQTGFDSDRIPEVPHCATKHRISGKLIPP